MMRAVGLALGILALAVITLGTDWTGVEILPGVWRDRVTPGRWALFGALLVALGLVSGRWVPQWSRRLAVLVPVLLWVLWHLRHGTLWPIAFTIYACAILVCWLGGCALSSRLWPSRRP
jgi:hypothetical protein